MNKKINLSWVWIVLISITVYSALQNFSAVVEFLVSSLALFTPFLVGGAIAFIVNVPMSKIEKILFKKENKFARPISLVTTLLLFVGVGYLISVLVIPNLKEAFSTLPQQISSGVTNIMQYVQSFSVSSDEIMSFIEQLSFDWDSIMKSVLSVGQNLLNVTLSSGTSIVGSVIGAIVNMIVAFIFALYVLLQKEKLARHSKMIIKALLPYKVAKKIIEVASLSYEIFSKFLSGQCLEAIILGSMFVVAMSILGMPYAVLIGVLVSVTALIPLVGAFIACAIGVFLIALINPMQALGFLVLFLILQQVEGNLIYPYVVGNSVGLPSIWVLVASYIGGNLIGLIGMLIAIPLSSIFYTLFREFIYNKLKSKNISSIE